MSKLVVGVIGPGESASKESIAAAFELGRLIALEGWVLLTGGRNAGVMDAACRGAKAAGGLTVGILPGEDSHGVSEAVDIPIVTGMGQARNNINVLSSRVLFACGIGPGTASEVSLAIKAQKKVILLCFHQQYAAFFQSMGKDGVTIADGPDSAVAIAKMLMSDS
jgi:uncharacterized protein (TIGR00725 family)